MATAEQLIVKGKEQGYLTPDDILQGFPEIDAEPDQIFRIFAAFKEIGIEVTDGEKDFEEVEQIDDEMLLDIEMMDSVSLDDPVRMYLKEIGRVSLLTANDEVELAQAIEAKPLHDALKALNVVEEIDSRQRSVEEMLYSALEDFRVDILVGTGPEGQLFEVRDSSHETAPLAKLDNGQILSLLAEPDGSIIVGTGDPGSVARLSPGYAAEGRLVSESDRRQLTPEHYFKTRSEMMVLFADLPEALASSVEIAQRSSFRPQSRAPILRSAPPLQWR